MTQNLEQMDLDGLKGLLSSTLETMPNMHIDTLEVSLESGFYGATPEKDELYSGFYGATPEEDDVMEEGELVHAQFLRIRIKQSLCASQTSALVQRIAEYWILPWGQAKFVHVPRDLWPLHQPVEEWAFANREHAGSR